MENKKFNDTESARAHLHQLKGGASKMTEQKFESPVAHWQSRVESIAAETHAELAKKLNAFYTDRWVVGTQVFRSDYGWNALVYYKIKA